MTTEEFIQKLRKDNYDDECIALALEIYRKGKRCFYDVTAHYDELYGDAVLFND